MNFSLKEWTILIFFGFIIFYGFFKNIKHKIFNWFITVLFIAGVVILITYAILNKNFIFFK